MLWRLVDWSWLWILAVCCALLGGVQAFEQATVPGTSGRAYHPFLLLLKGDIAPQERLELRSRLATLPGDLTEGQAALLQDQVPQVVEVRVPTRALLEQRFDPRMLGTFPQVDRYYWDENAFASIREGQERRHLFSQQIQLGIILASVIVVAVAFVLNSRRNQLRMACEQAGVVWESNMKAETAGEIYLAGPGTWLKMMGVQALASVILAWALFLAFSQVLSHLDSAPTTSLAATTDWGFLWAAGCLAAVGKGLDLFRVRYRYERIRRALELRQSLTI